MAKDIEPLPLRVKIIGAGISGLASALTISRHCPKSIITIYESQTSLSEFGAGIQLSANATRVLYSLGLKDEFMAIANQPAVMQMRGYKDNFLGEIAQNPQHEWDYGYPYWQVYRPDFQRILVGACAKAGDDRIKTVLGKKAVKVDIDKGKIFFADGSEDEGDIIIGADGLRGKMRNSLPGCEDVKARAFEEYCFRACVPRESMMKFPETKELMEAGNLNMVWCGPGIAMLGYPIAAGALYNIVLSVPRPANEEAVGKWSQPGDVTEGAALLAPFGPRPKKLWSLVEECNKWTLGDVPAMPTFISQNGKFVVIADAAHAILPHSGQGACQALEDAVSLGVCMSAVHSRADIPRSMRIWNEVRQQRMESVRRYASGNQQFLTMPDGPGQQKRDQVLAMSTAAWKKELVELGEEGYKNKPKVQPESQSGDVRSPEYRMYLCGYDAADETRVTLTAAGLEAVVLAS